MALHGKKQGHLVTVLGWHKTTAHRVWHGRQPYRRDMVNQVASWLGIEPYELLMPPKVAERLREWRKAAYQMVAADEQSIGSADPAIVELPRPVRTRKTR